MRVITAQRATASTYALAECPLWDARESVLRWVDIPAGVVHSGALDEKAGTIAESSRLVLGGDVSAVVMTERGGLVVAVDGGLAAVDATGAVQRGPRLLPAGRGSRMNDAECDPAGRLLVGSLAFDDCEGAEVLLRVGPNGEVETVRRSLGLSNGIAFSPSSELVYHVDTAAGLVWSAAYDARSGAIGSWRVVIEVRDGQPDGLTVDADGGLWLAVWGTGQVRHFDGSGTLLAVVEVDAPLVSSVAFGGTALDQLIITTARVGLDDAELARRPGSGALFVANPGVTAPPATRFRGDTKAGAAWTPGPDPQSTPTTERTTA